MKLIRPTVELFNPGNPIKKIETIARVCTGTEEKVGDDDSFCLALIKKGHMSPFEHARILTDKNPYPHELGVSYGMSYRIGFEDQLVAMNVRDFIALFPGISSDDSYKELLEYVHAQRQASDFYTVKFVIDIGLSRELLRHRQMSFMERSTRYYGFKGGVEFISPWWYKDTEGGEAYSAWQYHCEQTEQYYRHMIMSGEPKQLARGVLPLSTATVLYMSGTREQWRDVLKLRLGTGAHPAMKKLMGMVQSLIGIKDEEIR